MREKKNIELYNEEVREIMKAIPGRIIGWGLSIIFLIFASILTGSYFLKYEETITAPFEITNTNPPVQIICKSSGRIKRILIANGQNVDKAENLFLINGSIDREDFFGVEKTLSQLDSMISINGYDSFRLPEKQVPGELRDRYDKLVILFKEFRNYINKRMFFKKMQLLQQQMDIEKQCYEILLQQKQLLEERMDIILSKLGSKENASGSDNLSKKQVEDENIRVIRSHIEYTRSVMSLKHLDINRMQKEYALLELRGQHKKTINRFINDISNCIIALKNACTEWRDKYLLSSPIKGKIFFNGTLYENMIVSVAECIAVVVPGDSAGFICRAIIPFSNISKIEVGQKAKIKLDNYPNVEFGMLTGKICKVNTIPVEKGYIAEISINHEISDNQYEILKHVREVKGTAEITINETRLIYRFIRPLKVLFDK